MSKIVFKKLHPFDVAFYEPSTDTTFVDSSFKDSKSLGWILNHEEEHTKLKSTIDHLKHEWKFDRESFEVIAEILQKKPLLMVGMFSPISYDIRNGKRIWGYDSSRTLNLIILISVVLIAIYLGGML